MYRLHAREFTPEDLSTFTFSDCGAALAAGASQLSPSRPLAHQPDYEPELVMNVALMMDPKLDPGLQTARLPSVVSLLERGAGGAPRAPHLPALGALEPGEVAAALDRALQCLVAWQRGATLPQSLMGCLWAHPSALATLCAAAGLPALWRHALPPGEGAGPPPPPPPPPPAAGVPPLAAGSPQRLLAAALLAGVLAALKCAALGHAAVVGAHLHDPDEEDLVRALFEVDCAWATPVGALAGAEAALREEGEEGGAAAAPPPPAAAPPEEAPPDAWVAACGPAAPRGGGGGGGAFAELRLTEAEARRALRAAGGDAIASRLHFLRALLGVHVALAAEGAAPAAPPLAWGLRFDLPRASAAAAAAAAALDSFSSDSPLAASAAAPAGEGGGGGGEGGGGGGGGGGGEGGGDAAALSAGF